MTSCSAYSICVLDSGRRRQSVRVSPFFSVFPNNREINVLWWLPAGEIPTLDEAVKRLDHLNEHGPSDEGWPLTKPRPR